jgi:hypothetical protein
MRRLASSLTAALLLAPCASARTQTPFAPPSVEFRMDAHGNISYERIRNTTLHTVSYQDDSSMLLVVEAEAWMKALPDGDEGQMRNTVRVQALGWDGDAFTRPLWTREERAETWEMLPDYVQLTTIACCGREITHTLYDLETGREVASHTGKPLSAIDQRTESLLVLYESPRSLRAPAGADRGNVQGVLRIVRGTEVTDTVLVTGRDAGSKEAWAELHAVELRAAFCEADGRPTLRQLSGVADGDITFTACFETEDRAWIFLPVRGGRFVLERARLPAGFAVRRGGW